ncbi:NAD(P)/FAD-dependent oxidoreductase [Hoyosella sp. YIM 151337]|uniref:flavin-containing monooxygenase n=1 Tax=Hoyosella sp. YIM 151337 TaxID=2992742 RepID=UPI002235B762|nr:NAD(P)/FAD-dependent oxidoreductase [Hoyosella sp. YIM 151337]MCW4355135.1 NAD(P)/FAD-dependent oxidoreductase [Hoyosella sp. YIM 151337]
MTVRSEKSGTKTAARHVDVAVIGSGFSGLGAAIKLKELGTHSYIVLERGAEVGGTWRDNTYPGAACDVPSQLYSYSFAPGDWSRSFSRQPEIQAYLRNVAQEAGVLDNHLFNCEVNEARWDEAAAQWVVETSQGRVTARFLISGVGALCEPALPDIPGIESFSGEMFHSARWDHSADLKGKRVAVIGTGASAIQIVPAIAPDVAHLDVYQRTAPWVLPRFDRPYFGIERWALRHVPGLQRLARAGIYAARETQVVGLAKAPKLMAGLQALAQGMIYAQIRNPELRAKVTPDFRIGCKRMLISNAYYPALDRENVDLVTDRIAEVRENSVVTADGTEREIDALIIATGFHVTDSPMFAGIFGRDGRSLAAVFEENGMQGYKGTTVAGFPNLFFLVGPNTGLGHTSMVFMIESQLNYVVDALKTIKRDNIATFEVSPEAQASYNASLQEQLKPTVWMTGGCASWYLDKHGNNTTLWPGFTFSFRSMLKNFDAENYGITVMADTPETRTPAQAEPATAATGKKASR